jgi:fido (protein-threonine AMPylation protein)
VIGLAAARLLSRWISESVDRPITESDVRAIHEIIMKNQMYAGKYKDLPNEIGNQAHKPTSPEDTPNQMQIFTEWMNQLPRRGFRSSESIVKAAAVHAWLTHIHPFYDGNGRLARLLANMILARENMPPLILKNSSHRARYLDALAFSDAGGDLSRLVLLFCRALERVIDDMQDPVLAQEMFEADINLRLSDDFKVWKKGLQDLILEISAVFPLYRFNFEVVGELSPSEYRNLRNGKRPHDSWFMKVYDENGSDIALMFFGFVPGWVRSKFEQDQIYPCIFVAGRDHNPKALRPFKSLEKEDMKKGYSKFVIDPLEKVVISWGEHEAILGKFTYQKAADQMAKFCAELKASPINFRKS